VEFNKGCCCNHDHPKECLWFQYYNKHGPEKAHEIHSKNCTCASQNNVKHESYCAKLKHFNEFRNNKFGVAPKVKPATFDSDDLFDSEEDAPDPYGL